MLGHKHRAACHLNDLPSDQNPMLNAALRV
jgi:hypothetical protein